MEQHRPLGRADLLEVRRRSEWLMDLCAAPVESDRRQPNAKKILSATQASYDVYVQMRIEVTCWVMVGLRAVLCCAAIAKEGIQWQLPVTVIVYPLPQRIFAFNHPTFSVAYTQHGNISSSLVSCAAGMLQFRRDREGVPILFLDSPCCTNTGRNIDKIHPYFAKCAFCTYFLRDEKTGTAKTMRFVAQRLSCTLIDVAGHFEISLLFSDVNQALLSDSHPQISLQTPLWIRWGGWG